MSQVTSQNALVKDSTVQTLNGKLDNINATLGGNANIAPVFNTATAYSKGDMVNYNGDLYVFTANHSAGAWTGSDAVQTKVSSELSSLKSGLIGKHGVTEYNLLVTLAEFDGVSSYGAYLNTAYNALQGYINALPNGLLIHIDRMNIDNIAINNPSSRLGDNTNTVGGLLFAQFIAFDIANGHLVVRKVDAIGKTYEMIDDGVYTDLTSNVPAAGGNISVNVTIYSLLS